jgi:hypothetical protein
VGEALTGDNAALIVVAEDRIAEALEKIGAKLDASKKQIEAVLNPDASVAAKQMQEAITEASEQLRELTNEESHQSRP